MKDASTVANTFQPDTCRNIVLVPNQKGLEKALQANCRSVALFIGVSDTFNQKILTNTPKKLYNAVSLIQQLKQQECFIRTCISTAFYCPYEGKIHERDVLKLFAKALWRLE